MQGSQPVRVLYYQSHSGRWPVRDYLLALPANEAAQIAAALERIAQRGLPSPGVTSRQIDGKLWELKFPIHRLFYVVAPGPTMWLLHAYKKQGQRAPVREIEVARRRMKEVLA